MKKAASPTVKKKGRKPARGAWLKKIAKGSPTPTRLLVARKRGPKKHRRLSRASSFSLRPLETAVAGWTAEFKWAVGEANGLHGLFSQRHLGQLDRKSTLFTAREIVHKDNIFCS
ncbi:hypothetical protein BRADI_1g17545v3 [Brachypodium distachyon]|uniref:Uncharacterized protein n=1 Tax=Brachypodium distachyon TaxID=15368 RepID=A0A2K2DJW0_BRADI|nr:hypothetical protein BRADI_1g17545v3 [Brachypodium distachyon]